MEIQIQNGSKFKLLNQSKTLDLGRGLGFNSTDQTVSRHHISLKLNNNQTISFKVNGKNPILVRDCTNDEIRVYKKSEKGEIKDGDSFCVCSKNPVWFNLKKIASEDEDDDELDMEMKFDEVIGENLGFEYGEIDTGDVSVIDPVKEFNFVVMGHEFDNYPKKMIRDIKNWDWFLEETKHDSDEDNVSDRKTKKSTRKKRKKGGRVDEDDDDVWTGESEEDVELIKKLKNDPKPKYSTRSKKQEKNKRGMRASSSKSVDDRTNRDAMDDDDVDDDGENDETLGGFIVDDEDIGEGNDGDDDDDEEEEFEVDEDEDDDE